ncbi:ribosome maturation factor RimM [Pseudothauera nasutitermitis]|uniref:Ribosome maturation factor RimM n=1 Tax=Pseudothauera nasutitermitis TaxID=2565930 RepID=A0A4V3WB15_9RHOO|nr:ribosome maturation factor RimM [Pseudothauera nasutitermitis]THF61515.1 ribosome maturation factor RimM [Pseudothauera nasutitermitis]
MIVLGRIVAPFGVQGWVKIHPFGDDPLSWREMPQWWLAPAAETPEAEWRALTPHSCRVHGKGLVAAFEEIADRNAAESFEGWYIGAPREALPDTGKDEYYWHDLVGLTVENESGEALGTVSGLLSTGVHDVLQVQDGEEERLIPFVAAYVLDVDLAARRIRVTWERDW